MTFCDNLPVIGQDYMIFQDLQDILERYERRDLDHQFDLIVCPGVLHHLVDPAAGLRALRSTDVATFQKLSRQ